MDTLENTLSMMKALPETDLLEIQKFTLKLFQQRRIECPFPLKSREDIFHDLEKSRKQAVEGKCRRAEEVFNELEQKYGL